MSIRVAIEHKTVYSYDRLVNLGPHVIRLRPAPHCRTPILAYSLDVAPRQHFVNWQQDPFGNHLARFVFPEPMRELAVTVSIVADMTVINPFDFFIDESAREWPFRYEESLERDLAPYLTPIPGGALLNGWVAQVSRTSMSTIDFLIELNGRLRGDIEYSVRMEEGVQAPEDTLTRALGSCRDSAWLLVAVLRDLGIAARFASGYLVQLATDIPALDGPAGPTKDFTDLHAWAEAYVPGAGWIGLDPTSGLLAGEGHIPLVCASTPAAAAPITGAASPNETTFHFSNSVRRIHEDPRVTLPYSESEWQAIDAVGEAVDRALVDDDARLTMGGEPTFVAIGDAEAPEWNTAADGPTKYGLAVALTKRLADELAPGALLTHTQGKWYPGEPLPRWQIGVHWRLDGQPLWREPELLADPSQPGEATTNDARRLTYALADALGVPREFCVPGFEDPIGKLWDEARLPQGPPPSEATTEAPDESLSDAQARAEIVAALDAERGEPQGYAIPLYRAAGDEHWFTGPWSIRREQLFLTSGTSPMGLRLPLSSIAWDLPPADPERSLFDAVEPLPEQPSMPEVETLESPPVRALCVEQRDGHVHVFLPPLSEAEHFLELIEALTQAASTAELKIIIEGYPPPSDTRLNNFVVTPDPGVIEINIHPSASWAELKHLTTTIYEQARLVGLGAEKFALDGIHTATGGGSHITLGGATPPDSPLLRRPDLLRSIITYWQHHPSLSYLFSGRFVGPTSQAPRVDEARHETIYELEIAFAELERLALEEPVAPWQVDRLFRNLLVDLTGNTHRAEICIDKLFSPVSERGRLGVIELRAFEMAPHPQMALVQALLIRALISRLWSHPYTGSLVRWGTELHDRFLLPWWIEADIRSVTADLRDHGFDFKSSWLDPFLEFRFPRLGAIEVDGIALELRMAIEPWNVLAEESSAASARFVDSSLERIQVRVDNYTPSRYAITVNGFPLPLQPTDTPGTYVAGVRYRAWELHSALHPTIAAHAPLIFDVVDRWSERSVGGCTYHVSHPGGRSYDRAPANANEADARRSSRFAAAGHTAGRIVVPELDPDGEYPRTLDLRKARIR